MTTAKKFSYRSSKGKVKLSFNTFEDEKVNENKEPKDKNKLLNEINGVIKKNTNKDTRKILRMMKEMMGNMQTGKGQSLNLNAPIQISASSPINISSNNKGGIAIPNVPETEWNISKEGIMAPEDDVDFEKINLRYPINFSSFNTKGIEVFAHVYYDKNENQIIYYLIEPKVSKEEVQYSKSIRDYIKKKVDIDATSDKKKTEEYIEVMIKNAINFYGYKIPEERKNIIRYYVFRDFIGLEKIEPLLNDDNIEDISCDGYGIPIYIYHRDGKIGSIKSNIIFDDKEELDVFTKKLAERCGKTISVAKPLVDGTLENGSRLQATLSTDIARRGSNFTIRMFNREPLSPADLIKSKTLDAKILAMCWMFIEFGKNFLISGGTATGKTTILNLISLFIKSQMKVVTIEDTAELRLPNPNWISEVARTSVATSSNEIDLFRLLKESFRQRPDYIIVGEVRGKEAYVLFQQMAAGHSGMSTIHAEDFNKLVYRLTTKPIELPAYLLQSLNIIMFMKRIKYGRIYVRRLQSMIEVIGFDKNDNSPIINEIIRWSPKDDTYKIINKSVTLRRVSEALGMNEAEISENLQNRIKLVNWMVKKDLKDFKEIAKLVDSFYSSPDTLMQRIDEEL